VPHDASWGASIFWHLGHNAKNKHGGSKGFVLQKIGGSTKGKGTRHKAKQWRWKINHTSKGVVVNGSGNGISRITWTQGKKGARSISEIDQAPGAPLH
jgi:hypothetical protein